MNGIEYTLSSADVFTAVRFNKSSLEFAAPPSKLDSVTYVDSTLQLSGAKGMDIFDMKGEGSVYGDSQRTIAMFQPQLPNAVAYLWRPDFGRYTPLSNVIFWNAVNPRSGNFYIGTTLSMSTKDSAGTNLGTVAVGIIKSSDGTGQIVISKQTSATNYAPNKKRFITTDAIGAYTGPFGSGQGIFVLNALLTFASDIVSNVTDYSGYSIIFTKYGYRQQVLSRNWAYNIANAETGYMITDPYIVASYAVAIAYTGIAVTPVTPTTGAISITSAHTFSELYDFIKARVDFEAKTNDVHIVDPLITTDDINYTLGSGWTISGVNNLTFGIDRLSGGKIIFSTVGIYAVKVGTIALEFSAATGTYDLRTSDITGTITLKNTGGGSITVQLPVGVTVINNGPLITVVQTATVNITVS